MKYCSNCGRSEREVDFLERRTKCYECRKEDRKEWARQNPERNRELVRAAHERNYPKLRREVFLHYGKGSLVCRCCGEKEESFLTLDHLEGGGTKHRKSGEFSYRRLKKSGYPSGYQILCFNCNWGRYKNGGICPHKKTLLVIPPPYTAARIQLSVNGITKSAKEWAATTGISVFLIYSRLRRGISPELAINPSVRLRIGPPPCTDGCGCKRHDALKWNRKIDRSKRRI
jgi:hypothetical protein